MGQTSEQPNINGDDLVKIMQWLFERFCKEEGVVESARPNLQPAYFFNWFMSNAGNLNALTVAGELEVTVDSVNYIISLTASQLGPNRLMNFWPYLALGKRDAKNPVLSAAAALLVQWQDGTVAAITQLTHADTQKHPLRDAEVSHLLLMGSSAVNGIFSQVGLDHIHDKNKDFVGCVLPETLGFIEEAIEHVFERAAGCSESEMAQIKDRADKAMKLIQWVRGVFPFAVPGSVRMAMAQGKQIVETTPEPAPTVDEAKPNPPVGGWQH